MQCRGAVCVQYGMIVFEWDALVTETFKGRATAEAGNVAKSSPVYMGVMAVLEANFAFCIECEQERPRFKPRQTLLEILNDQRKASTLPYLLSRNSDVPK